MAHYSIIIPCRDATERVAAIVVELVRELDKLVLPYEIIFVDDGSSPQEVRGLEDLARSQPHARVLRFAEPRGTSAALTAGVAAARGDLLIAIGGSGSFRMRYVPHLIARLAHSELAFAEAERPWLKQVGNSLSNFIQAAIGVRHASHTKQLFWAARRPAVAGIALASGAYLALPAIVARRGFRVCRLTISRDLPPRGAEFRLNPLRLALAAWLDRRYEPHLASELPAGRAIGEGSDVELARAGLFRGRVLPPAAVPAKHGSHEAP